MIDFARIRNQLGTIGIGLSDSQTFLASQGQTVSQYFAGRAAQGGFPNAYTEGNSIYFLIGGTQTETFQAIAGASAFTVSPEWLAGALVHEVFHTLGASDAGLIGSFNTDPRWNPGASSGRVSTILAQDCFGAK